MRNNSVIPVAVMFASLLASAALAGAADPFVGKWKLNLAKSKYQAGQAPKEYEVRIKNFGDGLKCSAHRVETGGKEYREEWAAKYDGKDYPMTGDPTVDAVALKRIAAGTIEIVFKKGGKEIERSRIRISPDGKTTTVTAKDAVLILDRQ